MKLQRHEKLGVYTMALVGILMRPSQSSSGSEAASKAITVGTRFIKLLEEIPDESDDRFQNKDHE